MRLICIPSKLIVYFIETSDEELVLIFGEFELDWCQGFRLEDDSHSILWISRSIISFVASRLAIRIACDDLTYSRYAEDSLTDLRCDSIDNSDCSCACIET